MRPGPIMEDMLGSSPATRRTMASARVLSVKSGSPVTRPDRLAAEEPMEIRVAGPGEEPESVAVTLRTPGNDFELAVGFLYTEGLIASRDEVASVAYCLDLPPDQQEYNVVTVELTRTFDASSLKRNFYATSSCGICGKASIEQVHVRCSQLEPGPVIAGSAVLALPGRLRHAQRIFEETGGLHGSALFDPTGSILSVREDVGRHNAVDKLVGQSVLAGTVPLSDRVLMVSGRVSFEIVQKAAVAGIPIVCAVSAPSNLAVDTAQELGMTLVGFVRNDSFNVYTHPERIDVGG
jgi:FdhD protein